MEKKRAVHLIGDVTPESISRLSDQVFQLWQEDPEGEITLYVGSVGGGVTAGLAFYELVRACKIPLVTIGLGNVGSMGLIVWAAGTRRLATANTQFLIHELRRHFENEWLRTSDLETGLYNLKLDEDTLLQIIAGICGQSREELHAIAHLERSLTVKEAVDLGLLREEDILR